MAYHDRNGMSSSPVVPGAIGPWINTVLFLAAMVGLAAWAGHLVAGRTGALFALAVAVSSSYFGSRHADRMLLHSVRARPIHPAAAPELWTIVQRLTERAGVPMPRLWLVPSDQPNAFTVGRDPEHASIAVTEGLLVQLSARELAGVLAHEVAHIRNRDILLMSFAATITAMFASLGRSLWLLILLASPVLLLLAPGVFGLAILFGMATLGALLLQSALSREREFAADATAAWLTGDPAGLATALRRIDRSNRSLFRLLLGGLSPDAASPFQSHPPTSERVARLLETVPPHQGESNPISPQEGQVLDMHQSWQGDWFHPHIRPGQARHQPWPFGRDLFLVMPGRVDPRPMAPRTRIIWRCC